MKTALVLSLVLFSAMASSFETPSTATSIDANNVITLEVSNNDTADLVCSYSVTWLVNTFTFRKQFGKLNLPASGSAVVSFMNDKFAHISKVHSKVSCD